jgi:hypothetical protein
MLQLSGLGQSGNEYMECVAEHGPQDPVCGAIYERERQYGSQNPVDAQAAVNRICDTCGTDKWCDGAQCIPFTAAEQAEYQASGALPPLAVARPKPAGLIPGVSNKTLAISAGLAIAALLLLRR